MSELINAWREALRSAGWTEITDPADIPHPVDGSDVDPLPRYRFNPTVVAMLDAGEMSNTGVSQLASWYGVRPEAAVEAAQLLSGVVHDPGAVTSQQAGDRNFGDWDLHQRVDVGTVLVAPSRSAPAGAGAYPEAIPDATENAYTGRIFVYTPTFTGVLDVDQAREMFAGLGRSLNAIDHDSPEEVT